MSAPAPTHILIVDDDRVVLSAIGIGLRKTGYRVTEAGDSATALEAASRDKPDLAVLDVRMPDMPGVLLAERLAAEHGVPCMFLSAYDDPDSIQRAKLAGALGYLVKPLDVPHIVPSIEAALARAAQIQALKDTGEQLTHALENTRETSMAIGILMERLGMNRDEAFATLRSSARSQRKRVHDVASRIVDALEELNRLRPSAK